MEVLFDPGVRDVALEGGILRGLRLLIAKHDFFNARHDVFLHFDDSAVTAAGQIVEIDN